MKWLLALCLTIPGLAFASDLPALFDVVGVDASDSLNIRQDPAATSPVLGDLPHNATDVEVVALSETQKWGQVNAGDSSGWVSMQFLSRVADTTPGPLPLPLRCFGTEPLWSVVLPVSGPVTMAFPNEDAVQMELESPATAQGRSDKFGFLAASLDVGVAGAVSRTQCGDGMSDRSYGMAVDLLIFPNIGPGTLLSGCCSLSK